jgi:hypothetical protein
VHSRARAPLAGACGGLIVDQCFVHAKPFRLTRTARQRDRNAMRVLTTPTRAPPPLMLECEHRATAVALRNGRNYARCAAGEVAGSHKRGAFARGRCFRGGRCLTAAFAAVTQASAACLAAPSLLGGRWVASDAIQWRATAGPRAACVRRGGKRYAGGNGVCMARARCGSSSGTPACCRAARGAGVYCRLADNLPCVGQPDGCQKMCAIMYCCAYLCQARHLHEPEEHARRRA